MLSFKLVLKVAFLASLASTSPLAHTKLTDPPTGEVAAASSEVKNDVGVLNFALTLEHLEHQFYLKFLHRFGEQDFRRANIPNPTQTFQNFHHILQHEAQHVKTLQAVISSLGGTPLPPCKYDFGVDDVHGYMLLARNLEKVGVSAYDGAVALLNSPDLQTAAATIDTVEARHASFIATATGVDPFPEDFDVPLGGDQIVTLASAVIKECPFDIKSTLGAAPAGKLSLVAPHVVRAGREIKVKFDPGQNKPEDHFCGFLFSDKSIVSPVSSDWKCKVPRGCRGDIFVAILNKNEKLTMKNSVEIIVAGPMIVAVDTTIEDSCKKFVHGIDIEWKGYGIRQNKAYDVDVEAKYDDGHKSKGDSEYKSYDHSEVEESKEYPESDDHSKGKEWKDVEESKDHSKDDASKDHSEVDASKDHPKVEESKDHSKDDAWKDHSEVDASKDHPKVEVSKDHSKDDASKYHSEVDALKDHPKVEAPINHSEVDASSNHTEGDASSSHTEVTSESNAYETPKVESVTAYRKRGLIWSPSGHAEMPLSDAAPSPYEAPMAPETANISHDDYSGEMQSADELNGWMAVSSEHAEVETDPMENADMEHENTENMHKATENNDMVDDNTDNSDMEHDNTKNSDMEHDNSESSDMEHEDAEKSDMEHEDVEKGDMEHDNTENSDLEHEDAEKSDMEHDNSESSDMEHDDAENSDMEHDSTENSDMEHEDAEKSDMEHDDAENSDMEHDNTENSDMEHEDTEKSDMEHDKMDLGESGDKSETEVPLAVPTGAEPSVGENLPTAVAVYNAEETKIAAIPLAAEATVPEVPKETNIPTASLPTEVTVSEAPKETSVPTTSPLPDQGAVPPQVPDAPLPIAGNDSKTEVDSTDDVIKELHVEVARVMAGESESDDTDDVLDNLEVDDEPASEDDGTEVLAADDDNDAASQIDNEDASDTGLSDSKISAADASNVVADLEAQLQTFAPQRKA